MQGLREGLRLADRYVLLRRLGAGGMSESWTARDERAGSIVALKFLDADLARHPQRRELFRKEWQAASRLMHAHIARVFEYNGEGERPFFAMQFIEGDEIGVLANEELAIALPPFARLADALRYAHGKSVVHRDVKSSNVLLDDRGSPHLLDFGLAAASSGGTPINSSPAQQAGAAPEPADDVYALGVLLHEIIMGRPPGDDAEGLLLERPSGERVPSAVRRLVQAMLAKHANERPSAEAVAERLAEAGFPRRVGAPCAAGRGKARGGPSRGPGRGG